MRQRKIKEGSSTLFRKWGVRFINSEMVPDFLLQGNLAGFATMPAAEHPEPSFRSQAPCCLLAPSVFVFLVTKL